MLSFDEKKLILDGFLQLQRTKRSNERVNYVYPESKKLGKVVVTELSPSGNGYVCAKYMDGSKYLVDSRGWVNVKDFSEGDFIAILSESIRSMSKK